nr:MAG TPA: hypothetical protein [Caudoviricetes sp.]
MHYIFSNNRKLIFLVKYLVVVKISCIFAVYKRGVYLASLLYVVVNFLACGN